MNLRAKRYIEITVPGLGRRGKKMESYKEEEPWKMWVICKLGTIYGWPTIDAGHIHLLLNSKICAK